MNVRCVAVLTLAATVLVTACTSSSAGPAPAAAVPASLVSVTLTVPAGSNTDPFDKPRQVLVPEGWTMSVFARVPAARLEAWTPDGALLVSVPANGTVIRLTSDGKQSVLLTGLNQPHGLTFAGSTLYVAQSDRVDAYTYAAGAAKDPKPVIVGLPDAKSPELGGQYAHALKSVAVGHDGAVYVSVGSTGNVSPNDLTANPPRASILRVPPGGGAAQPFAVGVRNGTGLAIAPDGAVWTAVNSRDNLAYPFDRPYGGADGPSQGAVIPDYVRDHPVEPLAKLTAGRNLGWPYCEPDADVDPGVKGSKQNPSNVPFTRDVETNADGANSTAPSCPRSSRPSAVTPRRWACPSSTAACPASTRTAPSWACTARGTPRRRARPRSRSFPGPTANSARSRPSSAGSRPPTGRGGAGRWPR